jgi:hypothetical protein
MFELGIAIGQGLPILLRKTGKNAIIFDLSRFSHFERRMCQRALNSLTALIVYLNNSINPSVMGSISRRPKFLNDTQGCRVP